MRPPFFAIEDGNVLMFRSKADLERYIESPDALALQVFDANGQRLSLHVDEPEQNGPAWAIHVSNVRLGSPENPVDGRAELKQALSEFLIRQGYPEAHFDDIDGLVATFIKNDWYTA